MQIFNKTNSPHATLWDLVMKSVDIAEMTKILSAQKVEYSLAWRILFW